MMNQCPTSSDLVQMLNISDHNTDLVKYNAENIGNAIDRHSGSFDYAVFFSVAS